MQSTRLSTLKPSAEHVIASCVMGSHSVAPAVHAQSMQLETPFVVMQLWRELQRVEMFRSPSGVQRTSAFALQNVLSAMHVSSSHWPEVQ